MISAPTWRGGRCNISFAVCLTGKAITTRGSAACTGTSTSELWRLRAERYFVDKTPWYSLILPELSRTFPCAHFLILLRNPLAALISLVNTWENFWCWIRQWRAALLDFPLLLEGKDFLNGKGLVLRYEQLVRDPGHALQCVCNWLRIDFLPDIVEYGGGNLPVFPIGDPRRVYQHSRPTAKYVDAWQTRLADPQMWRWTSDYLDHLGPDILGRMGYPYAELRAVLDARRPSRLRLSCQTVSLEVLLGARPGRFERLTLHAARVRRVVRSRGVGGTAVEAVRRLAEPSQGADGSPAVDETAMRTVEKFTGLAAPLLCVHEFVEAKRAAPRRPRPRP